MICKHCNGTGHAPDTIDLECVGCGRKVVMRFNTSQELVDKCRNVQCRDCAAQASGTQS